MKNLVNSVLCSINALLAVNSKPLVLSPHSNMEKRVDFQDEECAELLVGSEGR